MHIERIHCMIEKLTECAKSEMEKGIKEVDTKEMGEVIDMIKDLSEAEYYSSITKAMKESEYGEDYDFEGAFEEGNRKGYRGQRRDSIGRYTSRRSRRGYETNYPEIYDMSQEMMRDMDLSKGRAYYPEMNNSNNQSRYGYSRDRYMNERRNFSTSNPEHIKKRTELLEEYMDDLIESGKEMIKDMSPEEKQEWKTKLNRMLNM